MIGRTVGRYRIVAKLGEGGMGSVWKAEDALLGRSVALKFLAPDTADSPEARARFLREAQAASKLEHSGIETIYDVGEQDGAVFIALRLVDGETIRDRIARHGPLGLREAVDIALAATDALGHAHTRGILHRDISARNVMLTRDGQVVVVDFGLALAEGASRMTQSGVTVGTVAYMAPEVVQGQPADRRSEVYALGAVLYEMLTGTVPFQGDRMAAVLYAVAHQEAEPPARSRPEIPADLERAVLRALAKDPDQRPQSMEAFLADLASLREALPAEIPSAGAVRTPPLRRLVISSPPAPDSQADTVSLRRTLPAVAGVFGAMRRGWMWVVGSIVFLVAATTLLIVIPRLKLSPPAPAAPATYESVAVLPFRNLSLNPAASEHLAEGLGETLTTKLTQMSGLRVSPWVTARRFRDPEMSVEKMVKELRVDALLVGSFRQEADRIRGTIALVDGQGGFQPWAEDFDEPLSDLFAVQNRISIGAATRLLGKLRPEQVGTLATPAAQNVTAYEDYLKGMVASQQIGPTDTEAAIALFQKAVEQDATLAVAHVGMGQMHYRRYFYGWGGWKDLEAAEAAFRRGIQLNPNLVAARRGLVRTFYERGKSEESLKQGKWVAESGATDADALMARAEAYCLGGLEPKGLPLLDQVIERDPANEGALWFRVFCSVWAGKYADAIRASETYLEQFGEDFEVHLWAAGAYHAEGDAEKAVWHIEKMQEGMPPGTVGYWQLLGALLLRQTGRPDQAERLLLDNLDVLEDNLERAPDNPRLRAICAGIYGELGDLARLKEEFERLRHDFPGIPHDFPGIPLEFSSVVPAAVGEQKLYVADLRERIAIGLIGHRWQTFEVLVGVKDPLSWPGYRQLLEEHDAALKRLEALY